MEMLRERDCLKHQLTVNVRESDWLGELYYGNVGLPRHLMVNEAPVSTQIH